MKQSDFFILEAAGLSCISGCQTVTHLHMTDDDKVPCSATNQCACLDRVSHGIRCGNSVRQLSDHLLAFVCELAVRML